MIWLIPDSARSRVAGCSEKGEPFQRHEFGTLSRPRTISGQMVMYPPLAVEAQNRVWGDVAGWTVRGDIVKLPPSSSEPGRLHFGNIPLTGRQCALHG